MRARVDEGVHVYELSAASSAVIKRKSNIPLVTIAIAARGGAHNELPTNAGLTGLAARVSIKGTQQRTAGQIAETAEGMGGSISPSVSSDLIDWEITVPAKHFERALELLCDVAFEAAFPAAEFEVERKLALADLEHTRDDMYRYPLRLCLQQAFRGHAYGNTLNDVERSIENASAAGAAAWYVEQVQAAPSVFVVGDVDPDTAAKQVARRLPPNRSAAAGRAERPVWPEAAQVADSRDKSQTALAIAFPGPARNEPDAYTLHVLANAVGGLGGRLFEELRSKRSLAYSVALMPVARWLAGAFVSYIATSPEREDEARRGLLEQFDRIVNEKLSDEEVTRAQRYTIGTRQIRSQTNGSQLSELMHAYLLGPGIEEVSRFEEHILAVTPAAILAAAQRYFDPAIAVEGIVRGSMK